ncbi:hypothetical protein QAD02_010238 [Eretmocerus hayati]|uniref:Uncharacterized protein n=1 Tax=Eretmocerus hayati TaxID=131215 RepID=A0ACC2NBM3_9HYME|nr:hypothetical protein QAD02_010238 [Eretmocerus hayati]
MQIFQALHNYIQLLQILSSLSCTECNWLRNLGGKINQDIQPHQIVFFVTDSTPGRAKQENSIIQFLSLNIPSKVVHVGKDAKNLLSPDLTISHTKSVTLYILLSILSAGVNYTRIIDFLPKYSNNIWPRCLAISPEKHDNFSHNISTVLEYAWKKKFLDFTVLVFDPSNDEVPLFYNLDPFRKKLNERNFTLDCNLFPKKLYDVSHHPLKLPIHNSEPHISVKKLVDGTYQIKGLYYPPVDFAWQAMNFSKEFPVDMNLETNSYHEFHDYLTKILQTGEINVGIVPITWTEVNITQNNKIMAIPIENGCEPVIAVVPIMKTTAMKIPSGTIFTLFVIPVMVLFSIILLRYYDLALTRWRIIDIVHLLMGISARVELNRWSSKLAYMSIIITSVAYTNSLYESILRIKFEDNEMRFETLRDIDQSNLPVFAYISDYDSIFNDISNPYLQNIKSRTQQTNRVEELDNCVQELNEGKNIICFMNRLHAEHVIANLNTTEAPRLKIADLVLYCNKLAHFFEPGSPYAEEFMTIQRRLIESGISSKIMVDEDLEKLKRTAAETSYSKFELISKETYMILVVGNLCSLVAFYLEFLNARLQQRRSSRIEQFIPFTN